MSAPVGYRCAELNAGRLLAATDDARAAEFMATPDRIDGLAKRLPGFVCTMQGPGAGGDSDQALGWEYLNGARLWKSHGCARMAAE